MPKQRAYGADLLLGPIGGAQQSDRMQKLQPLTVRHIGPAARYVLHMPSIDQTDLKAAIFQDLEQWYPVNACRFHRYSFHTALLQPVSQSI